MATFTRNQAQIVGVAFDWILSSIELQILVIKLKKSIVMLKLQFRISFEGTRG